MIFDNMTATFTIVAVALVISVVAISYCKGCCIAKLLGKPCSK